MKQFVKALDKEQDCFRYLQEKFPTIGDAKLKEGIFDGPQIPRLFEDDRFITTMDENVKAAWQSFKNVSQNFLENTKSEDYENIVNEFLENYKNIGCSMSLKLRFPHFYLDYFPQNLGDYSNEQGERFHQDISEMESRYQGRWDVNMMADFCWMLQRDTQTDSKKRKRNPLHRSFEEKRVRYKRRTA